MSKAIAVAVAFALALMGLVGCETTAGYRKSAGGQSAHKTVKVSIGKGAEIAGNVIIDLDESQSNTGTAEQTGTAAGAASGNEVKDNTVEGGL